MIAALFVETGGCYFGLPGVDPWDIARDARAYSGPHPVVAHPPCQRWGRFWHGSTRKPHQYRMGEDGGCFASALTAVRNYGGVLEHPAGSAAWEFFGLKAPQVGKGWIRADNFEGWTCSVEQGHYGHQSNKRTWLYAKWVCRPDLNWSSGEQRIPEWMIERYGYVKARRIGVVAMIGGKDKTRIRNATPIPFRDLLIRMAEAVNYQGNKPPPPMTYKPDNSVSHEMDRKSGISRLSDEYVRPTDETIHLHHPKALP